MALLSNMVSLLAFFTLVVPAVAQVNNPVKAEESQPGHSYGHVLWFVILVGAIAAWGNKDNDAFVAALRTLRAAVLREVASAEIPGLSGLNGTHWTDTIDDEDPKTMDKIGLKGNELYGGF